MLDVTEFGATLFLNNYILSAFLAYFAIKGNVPERLPSESYASALVGKIVFAILIALLSTMPAVGPAAWAAGVVSILTSVGPGYFILSMVADLFFIIMLWKLEFYRAYKVVVFNLLHLPFVTVLALLLAVNEQRSTLKRVRLDLAYKEGGVVIGEAVECVRIVRKPVRMRNEADIDPHYDIRRLPAPVEAFYKPEIAPDRDFNPHVIIAGASGSGKTTLIYHLLTELRRSYPTVFVDAKGDISRALLSGGVNSYIVHVATAGVNPFTKIGDETDNELVEQLMASISVVEPVGSRQEHLIREAVVAFQNKKEEEKEYLLSYPAIVGFLKGLIKNLPSPEKRWELGGTGTRDALFSIYSKLDDLGRYFRDDGVSIPQVITRALKTPDGKKRESDFPIIVFNLEGIGEKASAIVLELILRKISRYLYHRGPLAYLNDKPLVLVVDEAYLVTRPMQHNGKIGGSRSVLEEMVRAGRSYGTAIILATQRLSDVADGIMQNCQVRICFNTTSPEDGKILGFNARVVSEVVSELPPGYAYIWVPNPRKLKAHRSTTDTIAIIQGYIFRMKRKLLQVESEKEENDGESGEGEKYGSSLLSFGVICYRCMLLVSKVDHCPICGEPPLSGPEPVAEKGKKQMKKQATNTSCSGTSKNISKIKAYVRTVGGERIRRRAAELHPDKIEDLQALSDEDIVNFIDGYKKGKTIDADLYVSRDLVKKAGGGKIRPTSLGKAILDAYDELASKFVGVEDVA